MSKFLDKVGSFFIISIVGVILGSTLIMLLSSISIVFVDFDPIKELIRPFLRQLFNL